MVIGYLFHPMNKRIDIDTIIYTAMYEKLAKEFHTVFFNNAANTYADGMQAVQVLALALPNVVPANVHETVVNNLVSDISFPMLKSILFYQIMDIMILFMYLTLVMNVIQYQI